MKYVKNKEDCQAEIDSHDRVCNRCGRRPVPIETVDNSGCPTFWSGCFHGTTSDGHFTSGVDISAFKLARKMVLHGEVAYRHMHKSEYNSSDDLKRYWIESQTEGLVSQVLLMRFLEKNEPRMTEDEFLKETF